MSTQPERDHWLVRPETIKLLWRVLWGVLAVTVAAQLLIPVKGSFEVDGWFGFGAAYGFLSCVAMVVVAKVLGFALKRKEGFYSEADRRDNEGGRDA